jgi:hypothetical protein
VVLHKGDEGGGRQTTAGFAARVSLAKPRTFALVGEALSQAASKVLDGTIIVVYIITVALPGEQYMQAMMDVIVPLGDIVLRPVLFISG